MNPHLSSDRISAWILGEREAESLQHLRSCEFCQNEVAATEDTLAGFRESARTWSVGEMATLPQSGCHWRSRPFSWTLGASWAAIAAAVLLAVFLLRLGSVAPSAPSIALSARARAASAPLSDAALMKQVDAAISRDVPDAMEPLNKLVAWDNVLETSGTALETSGNRAASAGVNQ